MTAAYDKDARHIPLLLLALTGCLADTGDQAAVPSSTKSQEDPFEEFVVNIPETGTTLASGAKSGVQIITGRKPEVSPGPGANELLLTTMVVNGSQTGATLRVQINDERRFAGDEIRQVFDEQLPYGQHSSVDHAVPLPINRVLRVRVYMIDDCKVIPLRR